MKITAQIEWIDPIMVPGELVLSVLCAIQDEHGKRVVPAVWSLSHQAFCVRVGKIWKQVDPVRWAYMPAFPEEP